MNEAELKATFKSKQLRLKKLIDFIKSKKKLTAKEVYGFMIRNFYLSTLTVDRYIKDLEASGIIKVRHASQPEVNPWIMPPEERVIEYVGDD